MFRTLANFFKTKTEKQKIDEYLADSVSLEEIERKIKILDRGHAPFQRGYNSGNFNYV